MKARKKFVFLSFAVLLSLLLVMVFPMSALADDSTPPPDVSTSEPPTSVPPDESAVAPTDIPIDVPTDIPTDVPTDVPTIVLPTIAPTDVPTAIPTEISSVDLSGVVAAASDAGVTLSDGTGAPLQLGTQSAATTLVTGDPYFTIGGITYGFSSTGTCAPQVTNSHPDPAFEIIPATPTLTIDKTAWPVERSFSGATTSR